MKTLVINDELHAALKAEAERRGESLTSLTETALQGFLTALQAGLPRDLLEYLNNQHHNVFASQLCETLTNYRENRNMPNTRVVTAKADTVEQLRI